MPGLSFVLDPLSESGRVNGQKHVKDSQVGLLEALGQFAPVLLPKDRLNGDQMLYY